MARYIDADALMRKAVEKFYITDYFTHISEMIDNAPTIDTIYGISIDDAVLILTKYLNGEMVEVVKCEDCKHQEFYYKTIDGGESFFCKETGMVNMHIDDGDGEFWCKYGERRGEE